jgi:hypothetical protein
VTSAWFTWWLLTPSLNVEQLPRSDGWTVTRSTATSAVDGVHWLRIPTPTTDDWEVTFTAERLAGQQWSIVHQSDNTPLAITFGAAVVQTDKPGNPPQTKDDGVFAGHWGDFSDPRPRTWRLVVHSDHLQLFRDGEVVLEHKGSLDDATDLDDFDLPHASGLYLITDHSEYRFTIVRPPAAIPED